MPRVLNISGEYPPDWKAISDEACATAGNRCIRCGHPYTKGTHGKGQWTPCDEHCTHKGPIAFLGGDLLPVVDDSHRPACEFVRERHVVVAEWRILTTHHLDGNKSNCVWWNLLALCQRCHLTIQTKVNPDQPYMLDHSDWFKPYVAGFYAKKYEGRDITREKAEAEMERLLAYEKLTP